MSIGGSRRVSHLIQVVAHPEVCGPMTSASPSTQLIHPAVLHAQLQARADELAASKAERAARRAGRRPKRRNPFTAIVAVLATLGVVFTLGAGLSVANPALDAHNCAAADENADLIAAGFDCTYLFNKGQGPDEDPVGELYVKRDASDNLILVTDLYTLPDTGHVDAKLCVDDDTDPINLSATDPDNTVSCLGNSAGTSISHGDPLPDASAGEEDAGEYEVIIQNLVEDELNGMAMFTVFVDGYTEFSLHFNQGDLSIESFFQAEAPGTKSGTKFNDLNGNGEWDAEEPGLADWTINAYADDGDGILSEDEFDAGPAGTDDTDADGFYEITLDPGDYVVCEVLEDDWTQTFPAAGDGDCSIDASLGAAGYAVTITSGSEHINNDFGNFELIDKSGTKLEDVNGDGDLTDGVAIEDWTIYLYNDVGSVPGDLDATDTLNDTTTTDASGNYSFGDLGPGDYIVCEDLPAGWVQTFPNAPGGEVIDTCDEVAGQAEWGYAFSATSGEDEINNDFGNFELIDKSGTKLEDVNGDGDLTDGVAIEDWTIYLYNDVGSVPGDLDATDTLNDTTTTDASGNYSFGDLGPGDYIVCEDLPAGWVQTFPNAPGGEVIDTCDEVAGQAEWGYAFSATSGEDEINNDFGNFEQGTKSGTKFNDLNGDSVWDAGEPGLAGWTINVYADDGNGMLSNAEYLAGAAGSDVTDANGDYTVTGLNPGAYIACEVLQAGWTQSFPASGADCTGSSGATDLAAEGHAFTLTSGEDEVDNDFGNFQPGTKSGTKFNDLNGDGVWDAGEPGLAGWTINVYADDGNGILSATEYAAGAVGSGGLTDSNGLYTVSGLIPGDYIACEVLQAGWTQSFPTSGADCTVSSGATDLAAIGWTFTIDPGEAETGNDFGNFEQGTKSGTKFNDLNGDSVWDAGEPGLAGWTINVYADDGNGILSNAEYLAGAAGSDVTDANGDYTVTGLNPGAYIACEVLQAGWTQSFPASGADCTGSSGATDLAAEGHAFTLTSGEDEVDNDFGNFQPPVIEGCTPGFWKNHPEAWGPTGFLTTQTLESVFNVPDAFGLDNVTLIDALGFGGGKGNLGSAKILLRAAVAAILNASHPGVDYEFALADVIADVNTALAGNRPGMLALATELDDANNAGCPLGNDTVLASQVPIGLWLPAAAAFVAAAGRRRLRR